MVLLRSATAAGALSLMMIIVLILLSRFKFEALNMTVTFFEVMLIDRETFVFLLGTFPDLYWTISALLVGGFLAAFLLWWIDPFRLRFRTALAGCAVSFAALAGISFAKPVDHDELFVNHNYTSMFARSGALAAMDLATGSLLEADATVTDRLTPDMDIACKPSEKPPHIILVLDESGFDATIMPGTKVVPDYKRRFLSFDGNRRNLIVEGSGGRHGSPNTICSDCPCAPGPLRRGCHTDRGRAGRARIATRADAMRLPHLQHLSGRRRVPRCPKLSIDHRDREFFRCERPQHPLSRVRQLLL